MIPEVGKFEATIGEALHHDGGCLHADITAGAADQRDKESEGGDSSDLSFEHADDQRTEDTTEDTDQEPREASLGLSKDRVVGIDVGGDTGGELIVALGVLTDLDRKSVV